MIDYYKMKKIRKGLYHYTDSNGVVWEIMNQGYTHGYCCVMWLGSRLSVNDIDTNEIWANTRKEVVAGIERRAAGLVI